MVTFAPSCAPVSISEWHTLLPSPTYVKFKPRIEPKCSSRVMKSANAWQGCSKSDKALITGTREFAAISVMVSWAYVRSTITSTHRSTLRATSAIASRSPRGELVWSTKMALPPMVLKPDSKLSRVRRLAFSNISTICLASSAWRYSRGLRLTSWPSFKMARTSPLERSPTEQRSSPASRAAAARMSGSLCTLNGTSCRSIVALLATVSSCGVGGNVCSMFGEDFVESRDRCVHMFLLQDVGRQETQNGVAGAVDDDVTLEHLRHREFCQ